ncbi:MAG: DUF305 domain-containing protein, partial [Nitriliruptoraceae bacterium]
MSQNVKKILLVVAIVGLVAIPVAAVALGGPAGFAHRGEAGAGAGFGPVGSGGAMGWHAGVRAAGMGSGQRMGDHGATGTMLMGMSGHMLTVDSEFDYLTHMIPHHEEAIASAELLLAGTERPEMEAFARDIIDTQSAEVAQMQTWLEEEYPERDVAVHYEPMMRDLTGLSGEELDQAFLEDMVGHHMAAVMMSQQLLVGDLAEQPEVVPFAEQIRDSQHAEIMQMRVWLADWFGQDAMGPMGSMGP